MPDPTGIEPSKAAVQSVVCTLAEGHYFYGVAALANSVARAGFKGTIVVGCRGPRPTWLTALEPGPSADSFLITPDITLALVEVPGDWHLNNCKPRFLEQVLLDLYPQSDVVYYFDSDIVIKHSWDIFVTWANSGIVVVLDPADTYMPPNHAYRVAWRSLAGRKGFECRDVTGYANGGCVGIARAHASFATVWRALMEQLASDGANMQKMKNSTDMLEFTRMDQDVLNATIMATATPISVLGPESMGLFPWVGNIMPHAMWHDKPWRRNYVFDSLRGFPPDRVHRAYWEFVDGPVRPFTKQERISKRLQLIAAMLIGRIYSRSYRDI